MKNLIIFLLLLLTQTCCIAASSNTGVTAGSFLNIFGGCRPASMGDAFIAISDDNNGIYWNPAGLSQIKRPTLSSIYGSWLTGINFANISYVNPLDRFTYGVSLSYVNYGEIEETTLGQPGGTGRLFSPTNYAIYSSLAYKLNSRMSIGFNGKYLTDNIDNNTASGYGADASILWLANDQLTYGACARNILSKFGNYSLPSNYGLGLSYKLPFLTIAADYNIPNDNNSTINLGLECQYMNILSGRLGYNTRSEELAGGNLGIGLGLNMSSISFDYAYVPYGDLGTTHRLTINAFPTFGYNPIVSEIKIIPQDATIIAGEAMRFVAEQFDNRSNPISANSTWSYDGNLGTMESSSGKFFARNAGSGKIYATAGEITATAKITVKASKPIKITVTPSKAETYFRGIVRFTVELLDAFGNECDIKPEYELTPNIGQISKDGEFLALHEGQGELIVKYGNLSKKVSITVSR